MTNLVKLYLVILTILFNVMAWDTTDYDRCCLPLETGMCKAAFTKYGYNVTTGKCTSFIYGGCGGNDNRFDTIEDCIEVCEC